MSCSDNQKDLLKRGSTHCNGKSHIVDTCFWLHGYLDCHPKSKKAPQASFNNQEKNINPKINLATSSGFFAQLGKSFISNSDWIVYLGAADHMICDRQKFDKLSNCSINIVTNANGVSSLIVGICTIPLSSSFDIKNVLFVPSLNFNLLSIQKLTKSHNISCIFSHSLYFLRPLHQGED